MQEPPFTALAQVYDEIMADVDYDDWCDFVVREAEKRGFRHGPVLDLGCGTGNMTIPLSQRGLSIVGLDSSPSMLAVAQRKAPQIDWHLADFTGFVLDRRFELVVSVFDSLNNLVSAEQFLAAAGCVLDHLQPGGLFLFDVNTTVGLRELWEGDRVEGWAGEIYYRWDHDYDPHTNLAKVEAYCDTGSRSFTEVHFERPYDEPEIRLLLASAGFTHVEALSFPGGTAAESNAERIWVCAKKH